MKQLTLKQRYVIEALLKESYAASQIALSLGKDKSVISREISRNSSQGSYLAQQAHHRAMARKKRGNWRLDEPMQKLIADKLKLKWSPEQICGRMKRDGKSMVSHERIYQYVYQDRKEGGSLYEHLRWCRKKRQKRSNRKERRGTIAGRVMIDSRPQIVDQKKRIGDWEADTIIGARHQQAVLTLTERKTKFTLARKLKDRNKETATIHMLKAFYTSPIPVKTITSDNGKEFADHWFIAESLEAKFYFAHPGQAWQRGLNENTNGLLRQFIPKKSDFRKLTQQQLDYYLYLLNNRPRKALKYLSPQEVVNRRKVAFET